MGTQRRLAEEGCVVMNTSIKIVCICCLAIIAIIIFGGVLVVVTSVANILVKIFVSVVLIGIGILAYTSIISDLLDIIRMSK